MAPSLDDAPAFCPAFPAASSFEPASLADLPVASTADVAVFAEEAVCFSPSPLPVLSMESPAFTAESASFSVACCACPRAWVYAAMLALRITSTVVDMGAPYGSGRVWTTQWRCVVGSRGSSSGSGLLPVRAL